MYSKLIKWKIIVIRLTKKKKESNSLSINITSASEAKPEPAYELINRYSLSLIKKIVEKLTA